MTPHKKLLLVRFAAGLGILAFSFIVAAALIRFSQRPDQVDPPENLLAVRIMTAQPDSAAAVLTAHGVVRPLREARIAAEVTGLLQDSVQVARVGERVEAGDVLARIDPRDTEAALADARAALAQARSHLTRLTVQEESDRQRRALAHRANELAESEFLRTKTLFEEQEIGSISLVEGAEQAFTQAATQLALLDQALALYPAQREETEARVTAAEARARQAETHLARTEITAPFTGRITHSAAEPGEKVQPGQVLFHLADDQTLELTAPLEASEVRNWLQFEETPAAGSAWFPPPVPVPVRLTWAEAAQELSWTGTLHRIVNFDSTARTVHVAIRVDAEAARSPDHPIPLADGMFCRVEIPGRTLDDVYTLPRTAVTFDGHVYLADKDDRLRASPVEVLRAQRDEVIVRGGISPGDRVITTRLIAPLEGARLDIQED
ncbi:MAG: efflux RND transporter periplasmic adaptor subunit [Verrucomicrobia bacterium]|nr:efflux RND transporter periplasmic adaptor subunit [Verrucomicrobiota bacterium]MCH8528843.1 efflux RND transporter periplasmic adaptor subunit [Kiritimatiellia bacterium]